MKEELLENQTLSERNQEERRIFMDKANCEQDRRLRAFCVGETSSTTNALLLYKELEAVRVAFYMQFEQEAEEAI